MNTQAIGTMSREDKGPVAPPPVLTGALDTVAKAVSKWPGVVATTHWHFDERSRVDGIDFYIGDKELGHLHLDGSLHLATSPSLGRAMVSEKKARAFPYQRGWVCEDLERIGSDSAISLFRRQYEQLVDQPTV